MTVARSIDRSISVHVSEQFSICNKIAANVLLLAVMCFSSYSFSNIINSLKSLYNKSENW